MQKGELMPKKGKFIVIEGSDGSGKKTQADLLIKHLKSKKIKTGYYDFPQYGTSFFGKMVGSYLNGDFGGLEDVSPYLISILYAGDRFEASKKMKTDLALGKVIVSNRYMQSNMAFQTSKLTRKSDQKKFLDWLVRMEYDIFQIPKPDKIFYLYLPCHVSQKLVDKKSKRNYTKKKRDLHEDNLEFLSKVEAQYISLAKKYEWEVINCLNKEGNISSPEEIHNMIFDKI